MHRPSWQLDTHDYTYRLYRAQRLYVQLLPKSMFIAIQIGNGIRCRAQLLYVLKKVFSYRILQDTKVVCPFRQKSPSTKVVCPQYCVLRESADMLLFMTYM